MILYSNVKQHMWSRVHSIMVSSAAMTSLTTPRCVSRNAKRDRKRKISEISLRSISSTTMILGLSSTFLGIHGSGGTEAGIEL